MTSRQEETSLQLVLCEMSPLKEPNADQSRKIEKRFHELYYKTSPVTYTQNAQLLSREAKKGQANSELKSLYLEPKHSYKINRRVSFTERPEKNTQENLTLLVPLTNFGFVTWVT